jgi:hypothetical protein
MVSKAREVERKGQLVLWIETALCRLLSSISTLDMISSLQSNAIVADRQSSSRREKESIAMK